MTFSDEIEKIDTVRAYHVCKFDVFPYEIKPSFRVALFVWYHFTWRHDT